MYLARANGVTSSVRVNLIYAVSASKSQASGAQSPQKKYDAQETAEKASLDNYVDPVTGFIYH